MATDITIEAIDTQDPDAAYQQYLVGAGSHVVNLGFYEGVKKNFGLSPSVTSTRPADRELMPWDRESAISKVREIQSNFALAAWLVDRHINFMASFKLQSKSPYPEFNAKFERLFKTWKRKRNCDVAEQFSFDEMLQIIERHRVCDGDVMILKRPGGKLQIVEGDRVRDAILEKDPPDQWMHGVKCDRNGKVLQYHIAQRLPDGGFEDERHIQADHAWLVGYRRNTNQRRGIAPILPAINHLRTLDKTFTHAAAKELLNQELALVTKRENPNATFFPTLEDQEKEAERVDQKIAGSLGEGVKHIRLGLMDTIEIIESKNPSQNTQQFWETMIRLVLLCLKIPYSFYDGSKTNYYGAEGEYNQYFDSCSSDQIPMIEWLTELTEWLLNVWVAEGRIEIPDGETLESMVDYLRWANGGMPYFLMFRLVKDAHAAIMLGATTPQKFCTAFGDDFGENVQEIREAMQNTQDIPFLFNQTPQTSVSV